MIYNPLAKVIRNAFIENVVRKPLQPNIEDESLNAVDKILKNKRISRFEKALNRFFENCGEKTFPPLSSQVDEKNLLTFSLVLSGYIRDGQEALDNLQNIHALDADLIKLYKAAARYSVECSGRVKGSKYIFREHCDYLFWKVQNHDTLSNAKFNNHGFIVDPKRHNLFLSMPFHVDGEQEVLQHWTSEFLGKTLDNKAVFGPQVDVYLVHFPIEQPRGEKFALSLQTLRDPDNFFQAEDMKFVAQNFSRFLGKNVQVGAQDRVVSGEAYPAEMFKQNCRNITIVSYCSGTAHAHRWINAFSHLAEQMYDPKVVKEALQNIFVISYAFLPIQKECKYSGVHFMSNYENDKLRKEPFVKMFNPEIYEQCKYQGGNGYMRLTKMPDQRNFVMAMKLSEEFKTYDDNNQIVTLLNEENGHHMALLTKPNLMLKNNAARSCFVSVLENASLGRRGYEVFRQQKAQVPYILMKNMRFAGR